MSPRTDSLIAALRPPLIALAVVLAVAGIIWADLAPAERATLVSVLTVPRLALIGLLNSGVSAAYYLRLAFTAAQRPEEEGRRPFPLPQVGIAVGAALLFTTAATLWLGIKPGTVLGAAETAAHTLQVPGVDTTTQGVNRPQQPHP